MTGWLCCSSPEQLYTMNLLLGWHVVCGNVGTLWVAWDKQVTGAKPASHSTSFRKATGVVGDLTAMHPKMGEGGRVGRFIPKVHP